VKKNKKSILAIFVVVLCFIGFELMNARVNGRNRGYGFGRRMGRGRGFAGRRGRILGSYHRMYYGNGGYYGNGVYYGVAPIGIYPDY